MRSSRFLSFPRFWKREPAARKEEEERKEEGEYKKDDDVVLSLPCFPRRLITTSRPAASSRHDAAFPNGTPFTGKIPVRLLHYSTSSPANTRTDMFVEPRGTCFNICIRMCAGASTRLLHRSTTCFSRIRMKQLKAALCCCWPASTAYQEIDSPYNARSSWNFQYARRAPEKVTAISRRASNLQLISLFS